MIGFAASPLIHQGIEISILIGLSRTEEMILAERTLLLLHLLDGMAHLLHTALGFAHLIRQLLIIKGRIRHLLPIKDSILYLLPVEVSLPCRLSILLRQNLLPHHGSLHATSYHGGASLQGIVISVVVLYECIHLYIKLIAYFLSISGKLMGEGFSLSSSFMSDLICSAEAPCWQVAPASRLNWSP